MPSTVRDNHGSSGSVQPGRAARRLLAALGMGCAQAHPEPNQPEWVSVRSARKGVSVGGGRYPRSAADELVASGTAEWRSRPDSGPVLAITTSGHAHLKRDSAPAGTDPFGAQHGAMHLAVIDGPDGPGRAVVNGSESPLAWLRRRRDRDGEPLIDAAAFEAGERLRGDLTTGGLLPSVTARWDGAVGGGRGGFDPAAAADATIAARQRVRRALDAVGSDFAGLLVDLCGFLKGLETIERERRWPMRSAKVVLRLALARLAEHYGLSNEARGREVASGYRAWIAETGLDALSSG